MDSRDGYYSLDFKQMMSRVESFYTRSEHGEQLSLVEQQELATIAFLMLLRVEGITQPTLVKDHSSQWWKERES